MGGIIGNLIPLILTSYHSKSEIKEYTVIDSDEEIYQSRSYFSWITDIFYHDPTFDSRGNKVQKLNTSRVLVTAILGLQSLFQRWTFYESYYYAALSNLNNGVLMSIFCGKAVISSVLFYIFFSQTLHQVEIVGVLM